MSTFDAAAGAAGDPEQTADDTDLGWGERPSEDDPDDLRRFLEDVPPHHGS